MISSGALAYNLTALTCKYPSAIDLLSMHIKHALSTGIDRRVQLHCVEGQVHCTA